MVGLKLKNPKKIITTYYIYDIIKLGPNSKFYKETFFMICNLNEVWKVM